MVRGLSMPVFVLAVLAALPAAAAPHAPRPAPPAAGAHGPRGPLRIRIPIERPPHQDDLPLRLEPYRPQAYDPLKGSTVSVGPLRARLGGSAKRAHIARYRLEGVDIMGGSVSGTFDGRGARLNLRWPPGDDD